MYICILCASCCTDSFTLTPSPTTSTSFTASTVFNSTDSKMHSTVNSPVETFSGTYHYIKYLLTLCIFSYYTYIASFNPTATVPLPTSTDTSSDANDKSIIIYFVVIGFLLASLLTVALIYMFIRYVGICKPDNKSLYRHSCILQNMLEMNVIATSL